MPLVTRVQQRPVREIAVPDTLSPSALELGELASTGVLDVLAASLRLSRKGGFTGIPLLAFTIAFLTSGTRMGVRPFIAAFRRPLKRIAAVADCLRFPSSASVSRAFGGIDRATAERFADVALGLTVTPDMAKLLTHPSACHYDSMGDPLHVLDIDPTVQPFRQRDLVEGDEFPDPARVAPGVPGYTGHYRGEVRIRHVTVCAAGPGLWVGYRISEDNPHLAALFTSTLRPALSVMSQVGVALPRVLVRGDGEFGSAGVARAIVDLGVQLLVRINRFGLLDRPEVSEALRSAVWEEVQTGASRVREAADLGLVTLHPSSKSADEGAPGIQLRVVVSRRRVDSEKVAYGTYRDGYQFEMFATTLSPDRWSPGDIVSLYGGRSVIENRFAQEDRELALGRTFSFNPHGQAVFTALGLFLWNHWTCAGFRDAPPAAPPAPSPRADRATTKPTLPTPAVVPPEPVADGPPAEPVAVVPPAAHVADTPLVEEDATFAEEHDHSIRSNLHPSDPFPGASPPDRQVVGSILSTAFDDLIQRPGWSIDGATHLRCPNGQRLFPFSVSNEGPGRPKPQIIIRTDVGACDGCRLRAECFGSARPNTYKQIARSVQVSEANFLRGFLKRHPPGRRVKPIPTRRLAAVPSRTAPTPTPPTRPLIQPTPPIVLGPWECARPSMAPAAFRKRGRHRHDDVRVEVRVQRTERHPRGGTTRRQSREERENRWRLLATVTMTLYVRSRTPKLGL